MKIQYTTEYNRKVKKHKITFLHIPDMPRGEYRIAIGESDVFQFWGSPGYSTYNNQNRITVSLPYQRAINAGHKNFFYARCNKDFNKIIKIIDKCDF